MQKVKYVMSKDVISCSPHRNLAELGALMWEFDCGAIPVVDTRGELVGIVTDRDVCIALTTRNKPASEIFVGDLMEKNVYVCSAEDSIGEAIEIMRKAKVRRLPVIDKKSRILQGIITLSDILVRADENTAVTVTLKSIYGYIKPMKLAALK